MSLDISIGGHRIEAAWHGPAPDQAPTLVLLHEGLGCVTMWRDIPRLLAERTGYGVLVYSRPGYGRSDPIARPRALRYMDEEAFEVLPAVLDQAGVGKTILVGHSDGASIATIYAGGRQDFRVRGLVLMAPHFFVEDLSIHSIVDAKQAYETGDLRERLKRHHGDNVDTAFYSWNAAWLDPGSRNWRIDDRLAHIRVPMLIVQGTDDQYGTTAQVTLAEQETYCPVETLVLDNCRHAPHLDQPQATLAAVAEFVYRVLTVHEGLKPAA
ncbi:MAG: alpha/beta fold hydrolase [Xanthobacteraceae bacterium]